MVAHVHLRTVMDLHGSLGAQTCDRSYHSMRQMASHSWVPFAHTNCLPGSAAMVLLCLKGGHGGLGLARTPIRTKTLHIPA